ncbi:MAG TPA: TolC family protein [Kofleriaceae bacterium]|jgi:outer membrane protein TolC
MKSLGGAGVLLVLGLTCLGSAAMGQPAPKATVPTPAPASAPASAPAPAPLPTVPDMAPTPGPGLDKTGATLPTPPRTTGLSIADAIKLAETRNERGAIADLNVVSSEGAVESARSSFLPALSASGNDTWRPRSDPSNDLSGRLRFDQPIVAPSAIPLYDRAKHNRDATRAQSVDDRRVLAFDTAKAFMQVLLAEAVADAAQRKLETAKADLKSTDAQQRAALVSSNDVTRARISVADAQREVTADLGNRDSAYVDLAFLVAQPVDAVANPADLLALSQAAQPSPQQLVTDSLTARPDLVAKKELGAAAHDFAREPRWRYIPSVGFSAELDADEHGTHSIDGFLQLNATWNIFDFTRYGDMKTRDAAASIADLNTQALGRQIEQQVRAAAIQLGAAQQALIAAADARDAARKSAEETATLYKQGLAKAIELIDANDQRFEAEVNYASVQFDVAVAYLTLRQAMGLAPLEDK